MTDLHANGRLLHADAGSALSVGRARDAAVCFLDPRVSRQHAALHRLTDGRWELEDLGGPGGTWLQGERVARMVIEHPVELRLGDPTDGPVLVLEPDHSATVTISPHLLAGAISRPATAAPGAQWPAPTIDLALAGRAAVRVGRATDNDLVLDDLQVSRYHAELRGAEGGYELVDLGSHNGTFLDGVRVERALVRTGQRVTIGTTQLRVEDGKLRDWPSSERLGLAALEARNLSVKLPSGRTLLDDVSFRLEPGELLAVVGPTGSGKSTLLRALTGFRPPEEGRVLYGGRSLYDEFDELRRTIGYVPQDDILHTTLTVRRALEFGAELRFPSDVTAAERAARVAEVMGELGLTSHGDTVIEALSGGQRKRTSVALELLTKPGLVFLDEPTSGLDPGYEKAVMALLRELADGGRALVVVTHSTQSLDRCDRVLFLAPGGVPAFIGRPDEALAHFGFDDFADIFTHLENTPPVRFAEATRPKDPVTTPQPKPDALRPPRPPVAWGDQVSTLVRRQTAVLASDRRNLMVLGGQAVVVAFLLLAITGSGALDPADPGTSSARTLLGALAISAAVIGVANTIREVVKEAAIYARERAGGLDPVAYLLSKMIVFGIITILQLTALVTIATMRAGGPTEAVWPLPPLGELILVVSFTGIASAALGLAISSVVTNSEKAMAMIALVFIVMWLFSGATVNLQSMPVMREIGYLTAANWGLAAAGSSVDLGRLEAASCRPGPPTPGLPDLACDARWGHDVVHWTFAMGMMVALTAGGLALALWALSRKDPVPSGHVLSPYQAKAMAFGRAKATAARRAMAAPTAPTSRSDQ